MGNNQGQSTSGNVFDRLGKGADKKETMNRKWKQERSQHSITQRVQTEANSQGLRNILLDDLWRAIAAIEEQDNNLVAEVGGSPFYKEKFRRHHYQKDSNS